MKSNQHIKLVLLSYVSLLLPSDIAAMRIIAISQRGRKLDFADPYWYCKNKESIFEIIQRAVKGYLGQEHNINHILRSLVYFEDVEQDPCLKFF